MSGRLLFAGSQHDPDSLIEALSERFDDVRRVQGARTLRTAARLADGCDLVVIDARSRDQHAEEPAEVALAGLASFKRDPELHHIPAIVIADAWNRAGRAAFALGADDVLIGPVEASALLARVRNLLRMKLTQDELRLRDRTALDLGLDPGPATGGALDWSSARVLVVPETPVSGAALAQVLATLKLAGCGTASSGAEALARVRAQDVSLIVLDRRAGCGTDALSLIAELRATPGGRSAAVLFVDDGTDPRAPALALDLGADDFVSRPVEPEELRARARSLLRRRLVADRLRSSLRDGLREALTDPLTGLFNRRYALTHLPRLIRRCRDAGQPLAAMLVDVDDFKRVNDRHGHAAGDAVLAEVADRLRASVRGVDLVARYGGEEFLVVLPETNRQAAALAAERMRRAIATGHYDCPAIQPVTISVGVAMAARRGSETAESLIERADQALYASKAKGRNRVSFDLAAA